MLAMLMEELRDIIIEFLCTWGRNIEAYSQEKRSVVYTKADIEKLLKVSNGYSRRGGALS